MGYLSLSVRFGQAILSHARLDTGQAPSVTDPCRFRRNCFHRHGPRVRFIEVTSSSSPVSHPPQSEFKAIETYGVSP
jgi:hypothetical protein